MKKQFKSSPHDEVQKSYLGNFIVYLFTFVFCVQMVNWNKHERHSDTALDQQLLTLTLHWIFRYPI